MSSGSAPLSLRSLIHMQPWFALRERVRESMAALSESWLLFYRWSQPEVFPFYGLNGVGPPSLLDLHDPAQIKQLRAEGKVHRVINQDNNNAVDKTTGL